MGSSSFILSFLLSFSSFARQKAEQGPGNEARLVQGPGNEARVILYMDVLYASCVTLISDLQAIISAVAEKIDEVRPYCL